MVGYCRQSLAGKIYNANVQFAFFVVSYCWQTLAGKVDNANIQVVCFSAEEDMTSLRWQYGGASTPAQQKKGLLNALDSSEVRTGMRVYFGVYKEFVFLFFHFISCTYIF